MLPPSGADGSSRPALAPLLPDRRLTTVAQPPLTDSGMAGYAGVLVAKSWSAGTTWNTAGNWTPAGVPAAGDDVTIARAGVTMTVDVNTANLNSIAVSNATTALAVSTFALNVTGTGASAINVTAGTLTVAGGTINDSGGLALAVGTNLSGRGTLNVTGTIRAPAR